MTPAGGFPFATTVRVIDRIHSDTANFWPLAHPTISARFTERNIFMLGVTNLSDRRITNYWNASNFT
jgi:hypothetical protein